MTKNQALKDITQRRMGAGQQLNANYAAAVRNTPRALLRPVHPFTKCPSCGCYRPIEGEYCNDCKRAAFGF